MSMHGMDMDIYPLLVEVASHLKTEWDKDCPYRDRGRRNRDIN
jgi:hypothetical protein